MHVYFILTQSDNGSGIYGFYGTGKSLDEARAALTKAAKKRGKGPIRVMKFTSALPFAPTTRDAKPTEADAWIGRDGSVNWTRCERELVSE